MADLTIILPPVSNDVVSSDLRYLTELLALNNLGDVSGGGLGGTYGYGADYENDTFMMHPFCWCDEASCPWCLACECSYTVSEDNKVTMISTCINCRAGEDRHRAPNFLHKPTGSEVSWYKYIGRGMEVELNGEWKDIFVSCVKSVTHA